MVTYAPPEMHRPGWSMSRDGAADTPRTRIVRPDEDIAPMSTVTDVILFSDVDIALEIQEIRERL